jgi:signal transduction histidine kinase
MAALIAPELTPVCEQERWRLCRELHDGVGAALAGIILCVGAAKGAVLGVERQLLADIEPDPFELECELRLLIEARRPPELQELGLVGALRGHASRTRAGARLRIDVIEEPRTADEPLDPGRELAGYRIATEAMANMVRHAQATRCDVVLCRDGNALHIRVRDDGICIPAEPWERVGLGAMRKRAAGAGGHCEWRRCRAPLTRVLVADDHPIVTRGLVALLASMPDMSLVATATSGKWPG